MTQAGLAGWQVAHIAVDAAAAAVALTAIVVRHRFHSRVQPLGG
jgi:hypothetical protein